MFFNVSIPTLAPLLVVVPLRTPCHPDQRPDGEKAAVKMNRIFFLAPDLTERPKDKKTERHTESHKDQKGRNPKKNRTKMK